MKRERYFKKEDENRLKELIQEKTGYLIKNSSVLSQAFRRKSFCVEYGGQSNEMLEFVGDGILGYCVMKIITCRGISRNREGDYEFRIRQGYFSSVKQELISNEAFAKIIDEWGISNDLIVGISDEKNKVDEQVKVKADLFESIIGAIAIDLNWDMDVLESVVNKALGLEEKIKAIIENELDPIASTTIDINNAINVLKELAEKEKCSKPKESFSGPESLGYDKEGNPIWIYEVSLINEGISRSVFASSKKIAKKVASYLVLCELLKIPNQYGVNGQWILWEYKDGILYPYKRKIKNN